MGGIVWPAPSISVCREREQIVVEEHVPQVSPGPLIGEERLAALRWPAGK
jgi:hypothetical protein